MRKTVKKPQNRETSAERCSRRSGARKIVPKNSGGGQSECPTLKD
jgi:hypothetical protein